MNKVSFVRKKTSLSERRRAPSPTGWGKNFPVELQLSRSLHVQGFLPQRIPQRYLVEWFALSLFVLVLAIYPTQDGLSLASFAQSTK